MRLILASSSPRRRELLELAGLNFSVYAPDCDESNAKGLAPETAAATTAKKKAAAAVAVFPDDIVIGADTIVVVDGKALGKPGGAEDAKSMLHMLSGRKHSVFTGVCVFYGGQSAVFCEKTDVLFYELTDFEINEYISTGEPFDKAGAYGIQGRGALFVRRIDGDYYNVVGLPLARLVRLLRTVCGADNQLARPQN